MSIFGSVAARLKTFLAPVDSRGWWPFVSEPYAGAWQNNDSWTIDNVLGHPIVYACTTLIANDIGKLPPLLTRETQNGIWVPYKDDAVTRLLKKPNRYQNHIQFKQWWVMSRLVHGNTYALKERGAGGRIVALYLLDPSRVNVLVASDGSVFYQLAQDRLNDLESASVTVPASEIIHDRMNCLFHPLVGISPLFAAGTAANQGLEIQKDSTKFFENGARPSGILTAPGAISDETAARMKTHWDANYTGANTGKVAVLGDGLKFESMRMSSVDAQLIDQIKWTDQAICSAFHVPAYKVGAAPPPSYNNIEALTQDYYANCLQTHIEDMELCLDEGLELDPGIGIELDLDVLFRMDGFTQIKTLREGVAGGIFSPDEARRRMNLGPVDGGDTPYLQQQNYSLAALAKRDAMDDPFGKPEPATVEPPEEDDEIDTERMLSLLYTKSPETYAYAQV